MAKRTESIVIRVSADEKDLIEQIAERLGQNVSEYIRSRVIDTTLNLELMRLGKLSPEQFEAIELSKTSQVRYLVDGG